MQLHGITHSATVWLVAGVLSTTSMAAEPLVTRLTNTTSFRLPFIVDSRGAQVAEGFAVLFGARDGGAMQQLQRVPISAGGFRFSAPADGTWQFAIRMTDSAGNPDESAGPLMPEIQVVVDTTAPTIDLELVDAGDGNVRVKWTAQEEFVTGSLILKYAEGSDGRWKPLSVPPAASGQATIRSRPGTSVAVRVQLADEAGNSGVITREIVLAAVPIAFKPGAARTSGPVWSGSPGIGWPPAGAPVGPSPFPQVPAQSPHQFQPPMQSPVANDGFPPAANALGLPAKNSPAGPAYSSPHTQIGYPQIAGGQPPAVIPPSQSWQAIGHQATTSQPLMPDTMPGQSVSQLVSESVFNVTYTIEDVGPSGLSSVEMFITENNGQQWYWYANDTDMQSPVQVDVQAEGTFGFAIRVRNGVGLIDPPPQPGDHPEIIVTVDRTAPTVDLAVPQVRVNGSAAVSLGWNVFDRQSTAVRLEWAASGSGPWVPVFDWQPDRGRYEWPVSPNMPHSMHFRLLARDAAGNIGSAQTSQPVLIDLKRPKARMIGVQNATQSVGY